MQNNDNYVAIMIDSLKKKSIILDNISRENARQLMAIKAEPMDETAFDDTIAKKDEYIRQLNVMDSAFQKIYDRVKLQLQEDKVQYASQIRELQRLVQEVTDKAVDIQAQEARNKEAFSNVAIAIRHRVKSAKTAKKVASGYYENMNKLNALEPQFMDQKK